MISTKTRFYISRDYGHESKRGEHQLREGVVKCYLFPWSYLKLNGDLMVKRQNYAHDEAQSARFNCFGVLQMDNEARL